MEPGIGRICWIESDQAGLLASRCRCAGFVRGGSDWSMFVPVGRALPVSVSLACHARVTTA